MKLSPSVRSLRRGFSLVEMLVVIVILGIIAALSVPAIKNLGKSNVQVSASRQLLDDLARARQLAISQRTTVYMVFVPEFFWNNSSGSFNSTWWSSLNLAQQTIVTNLIDKQLTGYNFLTLRSVGDQPGQNTVRYLSDWKALPDGAFIASNKFYTVSSVINDYSINTSYPIYRFNYGTFPFPTETNLVSLPTLPYVAFNYLGQLTVDGVNLAPNDEYLPLAQGTVFYPTDPNTKALQFAQPDLSENPPGNSTNTMFNIIRVDRLTGRATQLQQKVQ